MKIYALTGLLVASVALSACVVDDGYYDRDGYRGGRTTVEYNRYDNRDYNNRDYHHRDRNDRDDNDDHRWCPPGQAKKGNC